ncbi:MAG: hypothetical protein HPY58_05780 [Firmicutes bacterium]|nr:hypothetical protein [Bacillota bacterium]
MKQAKDSGFTLAEVLAASFILVLVLAVFIGLFHEGLKTTAASTDEEEALAFAQAKLEEIQAMRFEDVAALADGEPDEEPSPDGKYTRTTKVDEVEVTDDGNRLLRVEVSVSWNEGEQQRQVTLVTLVADKEGEGGAR